MLQPIPAPDCDRERDGGADPRPGLEPPGGRGTRSQTAKPGWTVRIGWCGQPRQLSGGVAASGSQRARHSRCSPRRSSSTSRQTPRPRMTAEVLGGHQRPGGRRADRDRGNPRHAIRATWSPTRSTSTRGRVIEIGTCRCRSLMTLHHDATRKLLSALQAA